LGIFIIFFGICSIQVRFLVPSWAIGLSLRLLHLDLSYIFTLLVELTPKSNYPIKNVPPSTGKQIQERCGMFVHLRMVEKDAKSLEITSNCVLIAQGRALGWWGRINMGHVFPIE
jgi:hypothetical protein